MDNKENDFDSHPRSGIEYTNYLTPLPRAPIHEPEDSDQMNLPPPTYSQAIRLPPHVPAHANQMTVRIDGQVVTPQMHTG